MGKKAKEGQKAEIEGLRKAAKALRKRARKQPAPIADKARILAANMLILDSRPDDKDLRRLVENQIAGLERMLVGAKVIPIKRGA